MKRSLLDALPWVEVESSNVLRMAWVDSPPRLFVQFVSRKDGGAIPGAIYVYDGVESERFDAVLHAHSIGSMLTKLVKRKFEAQQVDVEPDETAAPLVDAELGELILQEIRNVNSTLEQIRKLWQGALQPRPRQTTTTRE